MLLVIPTAVAPPWTTMLGFSLLPAVVMIAGAALAMWRAPGPQLRSAILHFAAGVIFSVVAVRGAAARHRAAPRPLRGSHWF